jgi:hypothetical protein
VQRKESLRNGIYQSMQYTTNVPKLVAAEPVRCLECGETYSKPGRGGTVHENPGCPKCGYLGWISASIPVTHRGHARPRFDADLLLPRAARAH